MASSSEGTLGEVQPAELPKSRGASAPKPDPPRILHVIKTLGLGGAESLLVSTAAELVDRGFEVHCAHLATHATDRLSDLQAAGVICHALPGRWTWPFHLIGLIRSTKFDAVHDHSPMLAGVSRFARPTSLILGGHRATRRPRYFSTEHNNWSRFNPLSRTANSVTYRAVRQGFAVSDDVKASMHRWARSKSETLIHGVDEKAIRSQLSRRDESRQRWGCNNNTIVIGTVATVTPQKRLEDLLDAFESVHLEAPNTKLVIVGGGPSFEDLRIRRNGSTAAAEVFLTGASDQAVALMAGFDIFALSSAWEGLPVVLMEASTLGLPIVATAVGGIPEKFKSGSAELVAPLDPAALAVALLQVVSNVERRDSLAERARITSAEFSAEAAATRLAQAYLN